MDQVGDAWNQRYIEHPWSVVPDSRLVELVDELSPGHAMDLGCGTGRNALWLARRGWHVTGVDASSVGLQIAASAAHEEGLSMSFEHADVLGYLESAPAFDLVVIANIHLAPDDRDVLFELAARAVAPRGHLYISGHHVDAFGRAGPPHRDRLFDEAMFRSGLGGLRSEVLERVVTANDADEASDVSIIYWAVNEQSESETNA